MEERREEERGGVERRVLQHECESKTIMDTSLSSRTTGCSFSKGRVFVLPKRKSRKAPSP